MSSLEESKEICDQCLEVWAAVTQSTDHYEQVQLEQLWTLVSDAKAAAEAYEAKTLDIEAEGA